MSVASHSARSRVTLKARRLPGWAPAGVGAAAILIAALAVYLPGAGGPVLTSVVAALLFLVGLGALSTVVEGGRAARNRVATSLVYAAFVLALAPLLSVALTLVTKGSERLNGYFLGVSMKGVSAFDNKGGAYHAIIGTLEQAGIATLITVPLGVLGAVYIVEYGRGRLAALIRFFVDVMTGIPSIVAGLFILAFWVLVVSPMFNNGRPEYSGFAAALALSVLMLPTIVRSTEEMLRLVPGALREGAYALGIPKWKTITKIVLPTAAPGIVTGVMLAVARACGETAPVILVALGNPAINFNPFSGGQSSLSLYVYEQAGTASKYAPGRAWAAALTLVVLVLSLTVAAKLLARRNKLAR
ncbi:phosphate ABC transporter permease PstA [Planosporangium flavigriseum]|uniref:Phosphate transport system permease protein PstA n=1 Tax=Planosporangium flavigriseum TaxID=373681 RepID=A0A8J3LSH8_9ACTN|nr:phosphate ABC transporter permease PstA [Planosporangium flavigriseum]NJC63683.1 phosphate ABC transporter permease PstA [Planosporangium flavigriseum]GIG72385.1 phosphate transport system permease protein PstA [Planosporangium flavigriseum]